MQEKQTTVLELRAWLCWRQMVTGTGKDEAAFGSPPVLAAQPGVCTAECSSAPAWTPLGSRLSPNWFCQVMQGITRAIGTAHPVE